MSRATYEDNIKFLLACVRNSNNGRVNFVAVAREASIVSKGAAAKRYERLARTFGGSNTAARQSSVTISPQPATAGGGNGRDGAVESSRSRKRKQKGNSPAVKGGEGDDGPKPFKKTTMTAMPISGGFPGNPESSAQASSQLTGFDCSTMTPPAASSPFYPNPMQGYRALAPAAAVQGERDSFLGLTPLGQGLPMAGETHAQKAPPFHFREMYGRPVFPGRDNFAGFDSYVAPSYYPQHPFNPAPMIMQAFGQTVPLPSTLPPTPQEVEPARPMIDDSTGFNDTGADDKDGIVVVE